MNDKYLLIMQRYADRDNVSVALFTIALALVVLWVIVETSPFLTARRPLWRNVYWFAVASTYVIGLVFMGSL
jgi:hypothetical protein